MRARAKYAAVVAAACLLVGGLTVANAAQLGVTGGSVSTATAGPCSTGVTVTRTEPLRFWLLVWITYGYEGVQLSGDLEGCRGRAVEVHATTGAPTVTGTVPTSGNATLTWGVAQYSTNRQFAVIVDGWQIPATTVNG